MVSLIRPDSGTALIAGYNVAKEHMLVRQNIGYVADNPAFYTRRMTTLETLSYICRLLDVPVNEQARPAQHRQRYHQPGDGTGQS